MGRSGRVNHVREGSPAGERELHVVSAVFVSVSITTSSPTTSPGLAASVTVLLPLTASLARLVGWVNLNHCVPTVMRLSFVPTGTRSLVALGPIPRSTTPL